MEITCWHCRAVFDPETAGKRCPNCGHHPDAWLAKLRFAASDFIGPVVLLGLALYNFRDDVVFSTLFAIGSLVWVGFIWYQDTEGWVPISDTPLSKPQMPETWRPMASLPSPREIEPALPTDSGASRQSSAPFRGSRLTLAEQVLIAALLSGLLVYAVLHRNQFADFVTRGKVPVFFMYVGVIAGLVIYAVRRVRSDEQVLRDGILTTGVLAGWYDKSGYSRTGYYRNIRIRYQFWTESGQKFEGSGTLNSEYPEASLSIRQEPLKVFYLAQQPAKNVALCCTTCRVKLN
jgi:hypothetical protein